MRQLRSVVTVGMLYIVPANALLAEPVSMPPQMLEDAELNDVFFLDPDHGWSVGDRGVIWSTDDGGRHWWLADSPVNCRLESIYFSDELNGWAVGGWTHPYSDRSSGVVLRTEDGGRRWRKMPAGTLPLLIEVRFFSRRHGWAVGKPSAMYPSGVFQTEDGGRSWSSVSAASRDEWLAADFVDPKRGVVVGRGGAAATVEAHTVQPLTKPNTGLRHARAVQVSQRGEVWVAGDGGMLLKSGAAAHDWLAPHLPLPQSTLAQIDFRAIAVRDEQCWLAGNPGTFVLSSADAGRSWRLLRTGQAAPINSVQFLDDQRGWAVGAFGTILATRDGGETWIRQRSGGGRAAVLAMFDEPRHLPLEALTLLCGNEGYLGAVELLTRRDVEAASAAKPLDRRTADAMSMLGVSQCNQTWQFPLRQAGLQMQTASIVDGWNQVHQGRGVEHLEEYVTLRIRQWRPEMLLTRAADTRRHDPLGLLVSQVATTATERAADPTAYPDHARILGLQPWRTKRLLAVTQDASGAIHLETSRLATQVGRTLRDHSQAARAQVLDDWAPAPSRLGFELLLTEGPRSVASRHLTSGLSVPYASDARRVEGSSAPVALANLRLATQKQEIIETLLVHAGSDQKTHVDLSGQLDSLTRDLPARRAGELLFQLAQNYRELGRYALAASAQRRLAMNYPQHELAEAALLWLVNYHSGSEVQREFVTELAPHIKADNRESVAAAFNQALPPGLDRKATTKRFDSRVRLAGFSRASTTSASSLEEVAAAIQGTRLDLFAEPSVRLAVASAHRRDGQLRRARQLYQQIASSQPMGAWRQTARAELWFESRRGRCPKPLVVCPNQPTKPLLDARLDDPIWQAAAQVDLKSPLRDDESWPASVLFAHDSDYLYIGAVCGRAPGVEYTASDQPRPRDPDLSSEDRLEVLIDVNRDYHSFYRLTVDHRGWTGEACWGDRRWDPKWHVAAESDAQSWTIEAAIPLAELFAEGEKVSGATWAVGVQRVVPRAGFQSWTLPASAAGRAEGFGYLTFEGK